MQRMGRRLCEVYTVPLSRTWPVLMLTAAFLLGGGIGCLAAKGLTQTERAQLSDYLNGYLRLAGSDQLPRVPTDLLAVRLSPMLGTLALGFSGLGLLGLPVLCGWCGFLYSFSAACFCLIFGTQGLLPAFALLGLPALFWLPALLLAGCVCLRKSLGLLHAFHGGQPEAVPLRTGLIPAAILLTLSSLIEYSVTPALLRAAAGTLLS